jgi:hypothetical protein
MEYFAGAMITLVAILATRKIIGMQRDSNKIIISYSQSNVYNLIAPFLPNIQAEPPITQASRHHDRIYTRIMMVDNKAYWIKDNTFYTANIVKGDIDRETAKPVDTMAMDKVQLDKMIFIIETLTKGDFDDYRNSG